MILFVKGGIPLIRSERVTNQQDTREVRSCPPPKLDDTLGFIERHTLKDLPQYELGWFK